MPRPFLSVTLGVLLLAGGAHAESFTAEQRHEIVEVVRAALKADPSILRDAAAALERDDALRQDAAARAAIASASDALKARSGDPEAGNPAGDVTVIEFYDPRCPYCRRMLPVVDALIKADPGVRIVFKDMPILGPASVLESKAMLAAQNQNGYLRMQDALMHDTPAATPDTVRDAARKAGLDADRLLRDMDDPRIQARIDANLSLARSLGVSGTPAFVVGQKLVPGAVELGDLKQLVAEARRHSGG
ncbi:MAG TPA: DsbA family protein [Acetobacteraceae bacterium]|nr:DsbA family protein [Acetobacteraceae bacterium]